MAIPGKPKYTGESEYGGKDGVIPAVADGHTRLTAAENRMVHRIWGGRTAGLMPDLPEDDLHYQNVKEILDDLPVRTNDREPTEQPTDTIGG